jgi:hypothetical protein
VVAAATGDRPATRSPPRDERTELRGRRPARGLAEPTVGDQAESLRRYAGREDGVDPLGDLVGRLEVVVLDVDDTGCDIATRRGDLAQQIDLGHLAVRELEHELVDAEAEHRVEDRPVRPSREWPAEVVPEAEVCPEPDTTDDRLDRGVEQPREVGRRVRVDGRRRVVDLDVVRALGREAFQLRAEDRLRTLRRGVARRVDLVLGPVRNRPDRVYGPGSVTFSGRRARVRA